MWPCPKCLELVDESFGVCWNCGTGRDGTEDPNFQRVDGEPVPTRPIEPIFCLRCHNQLAYVGTKKFHEGSNALSFILGDLGELFVNREQFDVYVCSKCGHVEFFVTRIGKELRPH